MSSSISPARSGLRSPSKSRPHFVSRRLASAFLLLLSSAWLGCASAPFEAMSASSLLRLSAPADAAFDQLAHVAPLGPGTVFPSPQAAAVDALEHCYLRSLRATVLDRRARGGAIRAVAGGFTYDEPAVADEGSMGELRYALRATDVAHFQHHPRRYSHPRTGHARRIEDSARRIVELLDADARPLFYLTPERYLRVYESSATGERTLARIAPGSSRHATEIAMRLPSEQSAQPLALTPTPGAPR